MVDRSRYVISRQYGRCIEGMQAAEDALLQARRKRDYAEAAACMKERDEWLDLANATPRFVHELPGAARASVYWSVECAF